MCECAREENLRVWKEIYVRHTPQEVGKHINESREYYSLNERDKHRETNYVTEQYHLCYSTHFFLSKLGSILQAVWQGSCTHSDNCWLHTSSRLPHTYTWCSHLHPTAPHSAPNHLYSWGNLTEKNQYWRGYTTGLSSRTRRGGTLALLTQTDSGTLL